MSYSLDFRERVIKFVQDCGSKVDARIIFGISCPTIYRWLKRKAASGSPADPKPNRSWKKLDPVALASYVKAYPDFTLIEYAKHFGSSSRGVGLALKRLKITRKKDHVIQRKV
jgi:transposase